jgi:hypothetical protein
VTIAAIIHAKIHCITIVATYDLLGGDNGHENRLLCKISPTPANSQTLRVESNASWYGETHHVAPIWRRRRVRSNPPNTTAGANVQVSGGSGRAGGRATAKQAAQGRLRHQRWAVAQDRCALNAAPTHVGGAEKSMRPSSECTFCLVPTSCSARRSGVVVVEHNVRRALGGRCVRRKARGWWRTRWGDLAGPCAGFFIERSHGLPVVMYVA